MLLVHLTGTPSSRPRGSAVRASAGCARGSWSGSRLPVATGRMSAAQGGRSVDARPRGRLVACAMALAGGGASALVDSARGFREAGLSTAAVGVPSRVPGAHRGPSRRVRSRHPSTFFGRSGDGHPSWRSRNPSSASRDVRRAVGPGGCLVLCPRRRCGALHAGRARGSAAALPVVRRRPSARGANRSVCRGRAELNARRSFAGGSSDGEAPEGAVALASSATREGSSAAQRWRPSVRAPAATLATVRRGGRRSFRRSVVHRPSGWRLSSRGPRSGCRGALQSAGASGGAPPGGRAVGQARGESSCADADARPAGKGGARRARPRRAARGPERWSEALGDAQPVRRHGKGTSHPARAQSESSRSGRLGTVSADGAPIDKGRA